MRTALPVLLTATALFVGSGLFPAHAADGASPGADADNPAPITESWMAGPFKAEPSTGEDPSSAEAIDESKVDDTASSPSDDRPIDPDAGIATADPEELGVKEHRVEMYKPLGSEPLSPTLDAK